ncbi:hypothetical protein Hte_004685 [Hypoxylon texense]
MDLRPTLDILGVDSLAGFTLEKLRDTAQAVDLDKYLTLQVYMGWLNEHMKEEIQIDLSHFIHLLLEQFDESKIRAVFEQWQNMDAEEDPTNRRKYLTIKEDFFRILGHISGTSNVEAGSASRLSGLFPPPSNDTDESMEGPMGLSLSDINQRDFNNQDNNRDRDLRRALKENIAPVKRKSNSALRSTTRKENRKANLPYQKKPIGSYVCKRCHKKGHWLADCPTNLDPAFDQAPGPDYVCNICRAIGKHFITLCPRNKEPGSWTQMRRQAISPNLHGPTSRLDRSSSSPHREGPTAPSRYAEYDTYRPDDSTVSSQWDHKRLPSRTKSHKHHRMDVGDRYRPKKLHNYSSSPLYTIREHASRLAEEGRLAYDNDVYGSPYEQIFDSPASSAAAMIDERGGEDEAMKDMPEDVLDDTERAMRDTDEFLGDLANEIGPGKYSPEKVALLDMCSKSIVHKKVERMKAAHFMD